MKYIVQAYAKWRYQLVHEAWHEHLASCRRCEWDQDCPKINKLRHKCDYWHLIAYGYKRCG